MKIQPISNLVKVKQSSKYEGQVDVTTGKRGGTGIYKYNDVFTYEGEWNAKGQKHGQGTLYFTAGESALANNSYYRGSFVDGEISGLGLRVWPDGSKYEGELQNGEMHGNGKWTKDDQTYTGNFSCNRRHGNGNYSCSTESYSGNWLNHKYHGEDSQWESGNTKYRGGFVDGKFHGDSGLMTDTSCHSSYRGCFVGGSREGAGMESCLVSGFTYSGEWRSDRPVVKSEKLSLKIVDPLAEDSAAANIPNAPEKKKASKTISSAVTQKQVFPAELFSSFE